MADAKTAPERKARTVPDRQMEDVEREQPDLFEEERELEAPTPEELAAENKRLIDEANARVVTEREARIAAERSRDETAGKVRTAEETAFQASERAITGQLESQTQLLKQAQARYKSAREAGDFDAEIDALDALTDAKNNINSLNAQKTYVTQQKAAFEARKTAAPQQQQTTQTTRQGYSQASQTWIDKHPEFNTNPFYKSLVIGAAQAAQLDGIQADTPAFFRFIEETVDRGMANDRQRSQQTSQNQQRRTPPASSMAAPPSRDTQRQRTDKTVSPEAVARQMNVTVQDLRDFARFAKMKFEDYVSDQANILLEASRGEDTGYFRGNEGDTVG